MRCGVEVQAQPRDTKMAAESVYLSSNCTVWRGGWGDVLGAFIVFNQPQHSICSLHIMFNGSGVLLIPAFAVGMGEYGGRDVSSI